MHPAEQDILSMVRAYTRINRPQPVSVIAHALDLTVTEVQQALDILEADSRADAFEELADLTDCLAAQGPIDRILLVTRVLTAARATMGQ